MCFKESDELARLYFQFASFFWSSRFALFIPNLKPMLSFTYVISICSRKNNNSYLLLSLILFHFYLLLYKSDARTRPKIQQSTEYMNNNKKNLSHSFLFTIFCVCKHLFPIVFSYRIRHIVLESIVNGLTITMNSVYFSIHKSQNIFNRQSKLGMVGQSFFLQTSNLLIGRSCFENPSFKQ